MASHPKPSLAARVLHGLVLAVALAAMAGCTRTGAGDAERPQATAARPASSSPILGTGY
jgi:hypothetical protein